MIANQKKAEAFLDEYERTQRIEKRATGSDPDPATTCYRLFPGGPAVDKLPLSPDGKPADSDSYRNDLEKLEKYLLGRPKTAPRKKTLMQGPSTSAKSALT